MDFVLYVKNVLLKLCPRGHAFAFTSEVSLRLLPAQGVSSSSPCSSAAFRARCGRNTELWEVTHGWECIGWWDLHAVLLDVHHLFGVSC